VPRTPQPQLALGLLGSVALLLALCPSPRAQAAAGEVLGFQKISAAQGGLPAGIATSNATLGNAMAWMGDMDGDGLPEVACGDGAPSSGGIWILSLQADGTVAAASQITEGVGGFTGDLDGEDLFALGLANVGDLDGNGVDDLAVGSQGDDGEGGVWGEEAGAVFILFLDASKQVIAHTKWGAEELGPGLVLSVFPFSAFGSNLAAIGDLDGDGITELAVGSWNDSLGEDGGGGVRIFFLQADGYFSDEVLITEGFGGFTGDLEEGDRFCAVGSVGDFDGDGTPDLLVGAHGDDDGWFPSSFSGSGALWLLLLEPDGTVSSHVKISDTAGPLTGPLGAGDRWGVASLAVGDLDGDGVTDLAVGSQHDGYGPLSGGSVWILFMAADGTVRSHTKIGSGQGGFTGALSGADGFGSSLVSAGDLDGDGTPELLAGAGGDDDAGTFANSGAIWVLSLAQGFVPWDQEGPGLGGDHDVPVMWGEGSLQPGPYALHLEDGPTSAPLFLVLGFSLLNAPFKGGVLVPQPDLILDGLATHGTGAFELVDTWPAGIPPGTVAHLQAWMPDASAPKGFAASNGLTITTP
jgi:hypothetical protein